MTVVLWCLFPSRGVMEPNPNAAQPMARFDSSARFDELLTYDSSSAPLPWASKPTSKSKVMNKYKLELNRKTVEEKLTLGTQHIHASTAEPAATFFPASNRVPLNAVVQTVQDELQTAADEVASAEVIWKQKIQARDAKEAAWDQVLKARANYYEAATPNNLEALSSVGLPLRNNPSPLGDLPAPGNLRAVPLNFEGQVDLRCHVVKGAGSYEWECKLHNDAGVWAQVKISLGAGIRVTGLTPLALYAFRVRAIGSAGPGAWSDEVVVRAP